MRAQEHPRERERIEALRKAEIMDTPLEPAFQDLVELAALICGTPIALISLVDQDRQWFKAKVGLEASETPADVSFCAHAILQEDMLVVPDATLDSRFKDNPFVTGDPRVVFYAGTPLRFGGLPLGTLCVIDRVPRGLTSEQSAALRLLSDHAERLLALRLRAREAAIAERALETIRRRQAKILNALPIAVVAVDRDGGTVVANDACRRLIPDAVVGPNDGKMSRYLLVDGDQVLTPADQPIGRALRGETVRFRGFRLRGEGADVLVEGTAAPIFEDGRIVHAVAAFRDATVELKAERALADHERDYRELFDNATDLIHSIDKAGRFVYTNRAWREALGYEPSEVASLTVDDVMDPDRREHSLAAWGELGPSATFVEAVFKTKAGEPLRVAGRASRNDSASGRALIRGFFHNVTARELGEAELRRALAAATAGERARAEFLSSVSHDLRSPLNGVLGFAQLLEMDKLTDDQKQFVTQILGSGRQLLATVDKMLDASQAQRAKV